MENQRRNWLLKIGMALTGVGLTKLNVFANLVEDKSFEKNGQIKQSSGMEEKMKLGAFSVSLSVKDLETSRQFYEKLGFTVFGGSMAQRYLIMKNEVTLIGLFQGMFDKNILTFNPGWDQDAKTMEKFDDVRTIQKQLKSKGISLALETDEHKTGPGSIMLTDPDGNQILIDQHI
jgi:catechol 2,3-dioxygenase-like lactoylglutathione lyase family enzyme